jgi:F-type H+-transporting ATPase subunit delta
MPNHRLATRYAKSVLDLAVERGELDQVYADVQWLDSVCKGNRDFVNMLRSPIIKTDIKKRIVDNIAGPHIGTTMRAFNNLLVQKGRESNLPEILSAFLKQYKILKEIHTVELTTASPLSDDLRQAIVEQVKKVGGFNHIELLEKVDPDLIGGFVLQVGDQLVDASVSYDLKNIAKQFDKNDFVFKLR